jgi:hypothetical protein
LASKKGDSARHLPSPSSPFEKSPVDMVSGVCDTHGRQTERIPNETLCRRCRYVAYPSGFVSLFCCGDRMTADDELIRRGDVIREVNMHVAASRHVTLANKTIAAIAALPAVQPVVKVKPLVWVENPDVGEGGFLGGSDANIGPTYHAMQDGWSYHRSMFWRQADTIESAKAAAQADYDARILAALDVQTAPEVQCCMCGKNGLSTVEDGGPECELSDGRWVCSRDCYEKAVEPAPDVAQIRADALREAADLVHRIAEGYHSGGDGAIGCALFLTEGNIRSMIAVQPTPDAPDVAALEAAADAVRRLEDGWYDGISGDYHSYSASVMRMHCVKAIRALASDRAALASIEARK